jgi:hypothetical protein
VYPSLQTHHLGLVAVRLGEILSNRETVEKILEVPDRFGQMAVVALGHPAESKGNGSRRAIDQVIISRK